MTLKRHAAITLGLACSITLSSSLAQAAWNVTAGKINGIQTYSSTDVILFNLDSQPTGPLPPGCTSTAYFVIAGTAERRQAMLSQALTAQARGSTVQISWDDSGSCITYATGAVYPQALRFVTLP